MATFFSRRNVSGLAESIIAEELGLFLNRLRGEQKTGSVLSLDDEFGAFLTDIIERLAFAKKSTETTGAVGSSAYWHELQLIVVNLVMIGRHVPGITIVLHLWHLVQWLYPPAASMTIRREVRAPTTQKLPRTAPDHSRFLCSSSSTP